MFIKKVPINIFVEARDRHNWGLFLVPDFLNTKPKRKLLFFFLVKYNAALSARIRDFAVLNITKGSKNCLARKWIKNE